MISACMSHDILYRCLIEGEGPERHAPLLKCLLSEREQKCLKSNVRGAGGAEEKEEEERCKEV